MKYRTVAMGLAALTLFLTSPSFSQSTQGRFGIGMNTGINKIYGDRPEESIGFGGGGFVSYGFLPFANVIFDLGYEQLKYNFAPGTPGSTTDLLKADLKSNLDIISKGIFRPYVTLGLGLVNTKVRNSGFGSATAASFFGGGGFRFQMTPKFDWFMGADYRFSTGDRFDNVVDEGSANDGYVSVKGGVTYYLGDPAYEQSDVIAGDPLEYIELTGDYEFDAQFNEFDAATFQPQETKDMEEYVKLKSKVDALTGNIDASEKEIIDLQRELGERKKMLTSLEGQAATKPSLGIRKNTNLSSFTEIYEEALTNYYNKNFSEALSLFQLALDRNPNHSLGSNCQFWMGQCLFAMNRFQESIDEFYKVLSFERSLKKDDSLFLLGRAYLKIGSGDRARESFTRLMRDFPNSEYIEDAKVYIARL